MAAPAQAEPLARMSLDSPLMVRRWPALSVLSVVPVTLAALELGLVGGLLAAAGATAPEQGVTIRRPLREMRGAEAQYLFELSRQVRTADPATASLGRRMRELRAR
jgi:hypothetical protein